MDMTVAGLVAWAGIVIPLATLAWSAWQYVSIRKREAASERFDRLFKILDLIGGGTETSVYSKVGGIFELRNYPEYREVIVRICRDSKGKIQGSLAGMMDCEFEKTIDYFEKKK
jgi:hypothetical protein